MTKCAKAMKICIICEGEEDYDYIKKLLECRVWSPYYIIKPRSEERRVGKECRL